MINGSDKIQESAFLPVLSIKALPACLQIDSSYADNWVSSILNLSIHP